MLPHNLDEFFEKMKKRRVDNINHAARKAIKEIIKNTLHNRLDAIRESMERENAIKPNLDEHKKKSSSKNRTALCTSDYTIYNPWPS